MATYTINYTQTEDLAMQYIAADVDEWIQNAAHERARIAVEEVVQIAVQKFLENNQTIPGSKEQIVAAAYENGWIKTAAERNQEQLTTPIQE